MVHDLDYVEIKFPVSKRDYSRIEKKNNISINVFCFMYQMKDLRIVWIYC